MHSKTLVVLRTVFVLTCVGLLLATSALPAAAISCGDTVGPGLVELTEDLGPCDDANGASALILADSTTLDLGGFQITCADTNPANGTLPDGVTLPGTKSTVGGGTITGCRDGVHVAGSGKNIVAEVESSGNTGFGILVDSTKNYVVYSVASDNGINGIQIEGDKNLVGACDADSNGQDGIEVDGSKNKLFVNSTVGNDDGYDIDGDKNKLVQNVAANNINGFTVDGSDGKLVGNLSASNSSEGYALAGLSGSLKFVKNTAGGNQGSGIHVYSPSTVVVKAVKNQANGNAISTGFDIEDDVTGCGAHVWKKNDAGSVSDPTCIH